MGRDDGVLETCSAEVRVNGKRRQGSDPLPKHTHTSLAVFHRKMCSKFRGAKPENTRAHSEEEGGRRIHAYKGGLLLDLDHLPPRGDAAAICPHTPEYPRQNVVFA